MKITRREWTVLEQTMTQFVNDQTQRKTGAKRLLTCKQVIAENLVARFKQELTFPKGVKP